MNNRPTKLEVYMNISEEMSKRSHDSETQVGCILVSNKSSAILATGFNGFVRGARDSVLPNKRPEKYSFMVHAEQNLIANCARHGISMEDCTIISTMSPCEKCMRLLFQCGITKVITKNKYRDYEDLKKMEDIQIIETKTIEGYYELTYLVKK